MAARMSPLGMMSVSCPLRPRGSAETPRRREGLGALDAGVFITWKLSVIRQQREFLFLSSLPHPLYLFCSSDSLALMLQRHSHPRHPFPELGSITPHC